MIHRPAPISLLFAVIAAAALALPAQLPAQTVVDTTFTMSDGVVLDALYALPPAAAPASGHPAIVFVHGFGGSKNSVRTQVAAHALLGYAGVAYSVRGQGNSGGEFDFFTSERVRGDLAEAIAFAKSLRGVNPDRVAVVGGSQGGIHAWAAAAHQLGVRAVVSWVANGRFDEDWLANDALNWLFARTISITPVRLKQSLRDSVNLAMQTGEYSFVKRLLKQYTTAPLETAVGTPSLILVSYHDQYFNPSAALRQFARIPGPRRICLYPGGHESPPDQSTDTHIMGLYARWIEHWLRDAADPTLLDPDSAVIFFDGVTAEARPFAADDEAVWLDASSPVPPPYRRATWYFTESGLSETAPTGQSTSSFSYANLLGSTPITFRTQPLASDMTIIGGGGSAQLLADGSGTVYQVNLMLFDVDPATGAALPVTRGHCEVHGNVPGENDALSFDLNAACHTVTAGHALEARIHGGVPLIPSTGGNDFGNIALGPVVNSTNTLFCGNSAVQSRVTLTVGGAAATAAAAVPAAQRPQLGDLFPNPLRANAASIVTVRCHSGGRAAALVVVDMLGRAVTAAQTLPEGPPARDVQLRLGRLPAGSYRVVLTAGGERSSRPLLVIR